MLWQDARNFNPRTPCGVRPALPGRPHRWRRFQSTHPLRGATRPGRPFPPSGCYFNPRTPCGVRPARSARSVGRGHFNPRTPCGVRPGVYVPGRGRGNISIHAPLAGCDHFEDRFSPDRCHFNPRTPCGVRPALVTVLSAMTGISIHAPLAGCDTPRPQRPRPWSRFQSTHPLRGATRGERPLLWIEKFQSTHPLRGATRPPGQGRGG